MNFNISNRTVEELEVGDIFLTNFVYEDETGPICALGDLAKLEGVHYSLPEHSFVYRVLVFRTNVEISIPYEFSILRKLGGEEIGSILYG